MRVEIVVDELVLRGVNAGEAPAVVAAMEARLAELGESGAVRLASRDESFRRASDVHAPASAPGAVGEGIAGAVWGAVAGGGRA